MAAFTPRLTFPNLSKLTVPRSYFLGHHSAGLDRMRGLISSIDVVIEVRDYRTPLTSRNPLFEQLLVGSGSSSSARARLVVYTKRDLGISSGNGNGNGNGNGTAADKAREQMVARWVSSSSSPPSSSSSVIFSSSGSRTTIQQIVDFCKKQDQGVDGGARNWLFGTRVLIVGMPNVGKSTLVNALRRCGTGVGNNKVARTGNQPGVTRKVGTAVKIVSSSSEAKEEEGGGGGGGGGGNGNIYVVDTPGVFVPYVSDAESMLKLALCGNVKDGIVPAVTLADYLLFHINLQPGGPGAYRAWSEPTNEIGQVLYGLARRQGRLKKGGEPDYEAAALQFIHKWRIGELGRFVLDEVSDEAIAQLEDRQALGAGGAGSSSWNQARKAIKAERKLKAKTS